MVTFQTNITPLSAPTNTFALASFPYVRYRYASCEVECPVSSVQCRVSHPSPRWLPAVAFDTTNLKLKNEMIFARK